MTDAALRDAFPEIPWDEPLRVQVTTDPPIDTYVCRYCLAHTGIKPSELTDRGASYGDIVVHVEREHAKELA